ncbi:Gfo/Idh/MocA family oxidoreductase [Oleiharenicola lentus]|uniref:Gfo/Idh/MocA family oxidoreductase n=2 Tax=Oleiharenicola lentus TaxID=2508720 RepID=A0A4Q1C3S3_9BACT|nr:Gfo/Idh/MocA family oxidoreductase [Oleiharenicola lentus]
MVAQALQSAGVPKFPIASPASPSCPPRHGLRAEPAGMLTGNSPSPWRTLIVGLGRIGQGYDYDLPASEHVFTHARAFSQDSQFRLVGGVDPDAGARQRFTTRYGAPAYASVAEAAVSSPDLVVVATPTEHHLSTVETVLDHCRPVALVCEKPLAYTLEEATRLLELCRAHACAVHVNYMRRTDPTTAELRARLRNGRIASPLKGVVWYSKGLYNSASHFVNLLEDLLGAEPELQQCTEGRITPTGDPEPDFTLRFAHGTVSFHALRAEDYFHNSMEWFAPNGRLRYERAGANAEWFATAPEQPGGLAVAAERLPGDFAHIQAHFTRALALALAGRPSPVCSGDQALATLRLLAQLQPFPNPVCT